MEHQAQLQRRIAQFLFANHHHAVPSVIATTTELPSLAASGTARRLHIVHINIAGAPPLSEERDNATTSVTSQQPWQRELFSRCIPYVARAFGESLQEMTDVSSNEHFRHLIGGEQLFEAVVEDGEELRAAGHALFAAYSVNVDASTATAVHCHGMCVDPAVHGAGIGGRLLSSAMSSYVAANTQRVYFTARTQNDAILKIFYHSANSVLSSPPNVFPACEGGDALRQELQAVAAAQHQNTSPTADYNEATGVFPGCYPPHLRVIFGGNPDFAAKSNGAPGHMALRLYMKTVDNGDAAMLAVRVK